MVYIQCANTSGAADSQLITAHFLLVQGIHTTGTVVLGLATCTLVGVSAGEDRSIFGGRPTIFTCSSNNPTILRAFNMEDLLS